MPFLYAASSADALRLGVSKSEVSKSEVPKSEVPKSEMPKSEMPKSHPGVRECPTSRGFRDVGIPAFEFWQIRRFSVLCYQRRLIRGTAR